MTESDNSTTIEGDVESVTVAPEAPETPQEDDGEGDNAEK